MIGFVGLCGVLKDEGSARRDGSAGLASWWPATDEAAATVELQAGGSSVCGTLAQAQQGAVAVVTSAARLRCRSIS